MSARPVDMAALLLVDPHARRIALARTSKGLITPQTRLQRGDGAGPFEAPTLSRKRLGASEAKATAFMDAAIRALYDDLGQLLAKPLSTTAPIPPNSPWARLARHHLQPDRTALTYLGRMIDPAEAAHRRHVRVFAAPVSRISNSVKRRGAERTAWIAPEALCQSLEDKGLVFFGEQALRSLGGRPRPWLVSFRAGQMKQVRL